VLFRSAGGAPAEEDDEEIADFEPMGLAIGIDGPPALETDDAGWTIRFAPHAELFRSGNEPQHLLRALSGLGTARIACRQDDLPPLEELDPEAAYLSWEIALDSDAAEEDLREVFDFVDGICELDISGSGGPALPPLPDLDELPTTIDDGEDAAPTAAAPPADAPPGAPDSAPSGLPEPAAGPARRLTLGEPAGAAEDAAPAEPPAAEPLAAEPPAAEAPAAGAPPPPGGRPAGEPERRSGPADRRADAPDTGAAPGGRRAGDPEVRPSAGSAQPKATVRVDLERIDRLVNLVGELVINQAMLSQSVQEAGIPSNSPVSQGLEEFMQLTRDIQDSVMMIRAQPVKSLFQRMSRIVREASMAVDKRVRLTTEGEATEIDKTVIERLADPLTHMIRNSIDHGLESREGRLAAGKPEEGCVTLTATHRSGRVVIEVTDDGGGIDRARVREIAERKGLIAEGLSLTDAEIDNLLFMPGFSTASEVSDLSGRGVGMDVVRSAIQELGGRITIASEPGAGTTFSISLPLTLAVLDGMVVKAAGETLVVPLGAIVETLSLSDGEIRSIGPGRNVLHIRDAFVPLLDLAVELGFREPLESYEGSVVLLIQQEDGARAAMVVESIEEQRQVVIKGLQDSYGHVPGIAAATILGDGQIALILDPVDLMSNVAGRGRGGAPAMELAG